MNTLYININGDDIQSADSIEVIGSKEDAIVNGFYYTLGTEILRGVNGIGSITKSSIIIDFSKEKPDEFKSLETQWEQLKCILLGEEPEGDFKITFPKEYLDWLQYNANPNYSEIYSQKYQGKKDISFDIDVEELYEEIIDDPIRKRVVRFLLKDNNYRNFDQIVVNDNLVTRKSKFVKDIIRRFKDIDDYDTSFVRFENYKSIPSQNNTLTPIPPIRPDEEEANISLFDQLFPIYGVKLGETTLEDIERQGRNFSHHAHHYAPEDGIDFAGDELFSICTLDYTHPIPSNWEILNLEWQSHHDKYFYYKNLKDLKFLCININKHIFLSPDKDFYLILHTPGNLCCLESIFICTPICPRCHKHHFNLWYRDSDGRFTYECNECGHIWEE